MYACFSLENYNVNKQVIAASPDDAIFMRSMQCVSSLVSFSFRVVS